MHIPSLLSAGRVSFCLVACVAVGCTVSDPSTGTTGATDGTGSTTDTGTGTATAATDSGSGTAGTTATAGTSTGSGDTSTGSGDTSTGSTGSPAVCGDGAIEGDEVCDDGGNNGAEKPCLADCTANPCGNGVLEVDEVCDDGDLDPQDGCSVTCTVEGAWLCDMESPSVCTLQSPQVYALGASLDLSATRGNYPAVGEVGVANMGCATLPSDAVAAVAGAQLAVGIDHDNLGVLTLKLVAPDGTIATLLSRAGGQAGAAGDNSNLEAVSPITFVTAGDNPAETMGATISTVQHVCTDDAECEFAPDPDDDPDTGTLAGLVDVVATGDWQVCVGDSGAGDAGDMATAVLTLDLVAIP